MPAAHDPRQIPLPKGWPGRVKSAVLHVISLARFSLTAAWGCVAKKATRLTRLADRCARQDQEIALLREELRIKDARMERVAPRRRPYYRPTERMAILELRALEDGHYSKPRPRFSSRQQPSHLGADASMKTDPTRSSSCLNRSTSSPSSSDTSCSDAKRSVRRWASLRSPKSSAEPTFT